MMLILASDSISVDWCSILKTLKSIMIDTKMALVGIVIKEIKEYTGQSQWGKVHIQISLVVPCKTEG